MSYNTSNFTYNFNPSTCCKACKIAGKPKITFESHNSTDKYLNGSLICPSRIIECCRWCNSQTHGTNNCIVLKKHNQVTIAQFLENKRFFEKSKQSRQIFIQDTFTNDVSLHEPI